MKGLKIIPLFLLLTLFAYLGVLFVEANRDEVVINFANYQSPRTALGLVVLTSILIGMIISGFTCSIEMLALYVQNKKLKHKLSSATQPKAHPQTRIESPNPMSASSG